MSWLWHSISEGRTTPGGAVSAVVEDDGFISLFVADPASGVYTARGSLGRTAAPLSNDLGDALTGDISVPGGEARLFERGATLTSSAGEALVSFAPPSIGVPSIATGEAASAAVLDPGAITCQTRGWDVDQCVVALRALFADRLALLPTGKPSSSVPLTLGAPVEVGVWGMWSSVSQGGTVPGAPVSGVLGQDGLISLFVADPGGGVYTVRGNHAAGWGQWRSVSQGSTTPGGAVTAVAEPDGLISLFLADPAGGVYGARGHAQDPASAGEDVTYGLPASAALEERQLYDIAVRRDDGAWHAIAPHSVYYRSSWHDFGIAHVTDIHLARRIDYFPGRLEAAGRPESARRMSNWNDRFRGFIRYANYLHRVGVLDVILATGDIIDYLFEADDDQAGGGNALFARETLLGHWPTERFPDVEELLVPIFIVPGNHDYRRLPYHLLCNLDLGLPSNVKQLPQFAGYKMNWHDAFAAQGGKPGDDVPSLSAETAAKAIEIDRDLKPYRTYLADKPNYVVRLGSHRIVMLDSGPDTDLPESKLDLLLYALGNLGEDERAAIGGSPNSEGVTDEMLKLAVDTLNETPDDGLFIVGLHAPLFSMALEENPYFFRETQREAQAGQVYGWLARHDEDSAPAPDEAPGAKARQRHPLWFNGSGDPDSVSYVKRGDPADLLDYGVSRGASTAMLEALAGIGQRRKADVILHGHIHRHNEFRLRDGHGELAYLTDFYTRNLTRYYPTRFVKDWTLPGTPDSDVTSVHVAAGATPGSQPAETQAGSERKYAVTVPPYPEPLSQAADPRAWWAERRPLVLQTEALGPFKNAEANLAGFRVLVVKDDVIERMHHVSIETLHAANYQIDWESLIAPGT